MLPASIRMCDLPSKPPSDEPVETFEKQAEPAPLGVSELGLSRAQLATLVKAMQAVVWRVGCPVHLHPLDIVNDAFIVALAKPISDRPSIENWKRFVAWMCKIAENATKTNRKSKHRRLLSQGHSDEHIAALLSSAGDAKAVDARHDLHKAFMALKPADQELIRAIYVDGKTIQEISLKQGEPWSTIDSRYRRALRLLYAILQSMIAAIVLFFPKKAGAYGARLAQHMSRLLPHATHVACAITVTVACGIMVPSALASTIVSQQGNTASVWAPPPSPTIASAIVPVAPAVIAKVEPEKPIALDELKKRCSASDMKSLKIARYLQASFVPFAFLVVPAVSQVACAGTEKHTPAPQEPKEEEEEPEGGTDPYVRMCDNAHRLGGDCPSKTDWYKSMGRCPDGKKGCQ